MGQDTKISWADHTFNGWVGCIEYSDGCTNCYARVQSERWGKKLWGPAKTTPRQITSDANWAKPLMWNRKALAEGVRRRVFAFSLADWAEDHPQLVAPRSALWALIRVTRGLDWLLLTKRAERIAEYLPPDWGDGYPNVWLGVSIESMKVAVRADHLRNIPAAVRWISYEPNLGPLVNADRTDGLHLSGIDWVVEGAESGSGRRPYDEEWARSMRDRCAALGIAFFRKQGAAFKPGQFAELDGVLHHAFPTPRPNRARDDAMFPDFTP